MYLLDCICIYSFRYEFIYTDTIKFPHSLPVIMNDKEARSRIIDTLSRCVDFGDPEQHFNKLKAIRKEFNEDPARNELLEILKVIGNPDRFLLLDVLGQQDRCVCELEALLSKSQPTVSHHLGLLEEAGLVQGWKKGKFTHYSLVKSTLKSFTEAFNDWISSMRNWFGET
ncbi:metalloregulator ArsR/SmtB family transcription factor [Candidatus Bathyarchaeota archaeon]|nr:metalloregulator ArsR/SmtB family transcription factor [Candidatus Bathyarchaeota archaeon]